MKNTFENILAVIPARGGSKGIQKKNIADLNGKPLISYSIDAALGSRYVTRTLVWTDCPEIAAVARGCGAEAPFLRAPEHATDTAGLYEALFNLYDGLYARERYESSLYLILFPTYPFKTSHDVDRLIQEVIEGTYSAYLLSPSGFSAERSFLVREGGLAPLSGLMNGQERGKGCFKSNNSITVRMLPSWRDLFSLGFEKQKLGLEKWYRRILQEGWVHTRARGYPLEDELRTLDIDHPDQLELAREVIRNNLFAFDSCFDPAYRGVH